MTARDPLEVLAQELRAGDSVISPHVLDPAGEAAALGELAGAGPRTVGRAEEYALVVEAVREGYLLHYGEARLVVTDDRDLRLLAGDYLYALGLDRLAALGDSEAIRELADLISLAAAVHAAARAPDRIADEAGALWLASGITVGAGTSAEHERAKSALRAGAASAARDLASAAIERASVIGITDALRRAADSIDFRLPPSP